MKNMYKLLLTAAFVIPSFGVSASADNDTFSADFMARTSCRARAVERYYCPAFGGGQWMGPYFDNGCSVKCASGQRAVCQEATCESNQSGRPVESSCTCK